MLAGLGNKVVGTFKGPGTTGGKTVIVFKKAVVAKYITLQIKGKGTLQVNGIRLNEVYLHNADLISVTSSSVYGDHKKNWGPQLAWAGVSNTGLGYFHSKLESNPWIQFHTTLVELSSVTIINRKDCCGERLKNLEVRAGMLAGLGNKVVGTFKGPGTTGGKTVIVFKKAVVAKYITLQIKGKGTLQVNGIRLNEVSLPK